MTTRFSTIGLFATVIFLLYIVIGYSVPISWYVDIDRDSYKALDACTGTSVITYVSERTPRWGIQGETYSQIVRFEGINVIETTIHRGELDRPITFGYEPNTFSVQYETTWFETQDGIYYWPDEGVYGANEWVTIYPLPLIERSWFNSAADTKFRITNCDV